MEQYTHSRRWASSVPRTQAAVCECAAWLACPRCLSAAEALAQGSHQSHGHCSCQRHAMAQAQMQAQAVASIIVTSVLEEQSDGSGKLGAGRCRRRRLPRAEPVRRRSRSRRRRRRRMRASLVLRFEFCEPTAVGTGAVEPSTAFCAAHAASDAGTRLSRMS